MSIGREWSLSYDSNDTRRKSSIWRFFFDGNFDFTLLHLSYGKEPWNWRLDGSRTRFNGHQNERHSVQSTKGEWSFDLYKPGERFSPLPSWPLDV